MSLKTRTHKSQTKFGDPDEKALLPIIFLILNMIGLRFALSETSTNFVSTKANPKERDYPDKQHVVLIERHMDVGLILFNLYVSIYLDPFLYRSRSFVEKYGWMLLDPDHKNPKTI